MSEFTKKMDVQRRGKDGEEAEKNAHIQNENSGGYPDRHSGGLVCKGVSMDRIKDRFRRMLTPEIQKALQARMGDDAAVRVEEQYLNVYEVLDGHEEN